jgi:hypothetical protein
MFEPLPEQGRTGGIFKLLGGLFLGAVLGILIPVVVFILVAAGGGRGTARVWVAQIFDLAILGVIGFLTYQEIDSSMLALGMMIGISLAFLLNAICGLVMLGVR